MSTYAADLARLCAADYDHGLEAIATLDIAGITATITPCGGGTTLVIRGTDALEDWPDYDLRAFPVTEQGDTRHWHSGMLRYARVVYGFAKGWLAAGKPLDLIVGHSLGAGAGQIIGPSLRIRTVCFASPRPLYSDDQPDGAELVTNYCAADDAVCDLPPMGHHVGGVIELMPESRRRPLDAHAALSYAALLEQSP